MYGTYMGKTAANHGILRCPSKQSYPWNWYMLGPLDGVKNGGPSATGNMGQKHCDLQGLDCYAPGKPYYGRSISSITIPSRAPLSFEGRTYSGAYFTWGWAVDDAFSKDRMLNLHNSGANYGFADGHVKWYASPNLDLGDNQVIYMPYVGLDYDGDGRLGSPDTVR
jgi:prepilin-type processing-associated H-X9-DG protein